MVIQSTESYTYPLRRPPHPAPPSFNFKPQEGPETPVLCYYGLGACEILADAPADCKFRFLFAFLLNQAPSVSQQDHIQRVIPFPFKKPQIHFTPEPCSSSLQASRGHSPAWVSEGEETGGRSSNTNNWSPKDCLLNSTGIVLFGRCFFAHFLIKGSSETVYFFNKLLNKHNKNTP